MAGVGFAVDVVQPDQRSRRLGGELGLLLAVDGRGIAPLVAPLDDLGAKAGRDVAGDLLDLPLDHVLYRLLEGAHGAAQRAFLGDDVPGVAGVDLGGRDDGRCPIGSTLRATIDCSAVTMCAPTTTGSMP